MPTEPRDAVVWTSLHPCSLFLCLASSPREAPVQASASPASHRCACTRRQHGAHLPVSANTCSLPQGRARPSLVLLQKSVLKSPLVFLPMGYFYHPLSGLPALWNLSLPTTPSPWARPWAGPQDGSGTFAAPHCSEAPLDPSTQRPLMTAPYNQGCVLWEPRPLCGPDKNFAPSPQTNEYT